MGSSLMVGLPEPVGRQARLGPFPSGREALKFASYAAVGAVVAGATTPMAWLPFLGVGFLFASVRHHGKGIDAHLADYLRWRYRARRPARGSMASRNRRLRGNIARIPSGRIVAVLATGGVPVAFLPERDARDLFDRFRTMLRGHDGGIYLNVDSVPVNGASLMPQPARSGRPREGAALEGYREMVAVLTRHRRCRRVLLVAWNDTIGAGAIARLEERVQALSGRLMALGLGPERLRDVALGEALASIGWELQLP